MTAFLNHLGPDSFRQSRSRQGTNGPAFPETARAAQLAPVMNGTCPGRIDRTFRPDRADFDHRNHGMKGGTEVYFGTRRGYRPVHGPIASNLSCTLGAWPTSRASWDNAGNLSVKQKGGASPAGFSPLRTGA